ncbi:MAG: hypothetical protein OXT09_10155 [Myxococcales bacterium]|nr:hypothetical protein [Myxococcales bacterium]
MGEESQGALERLELSRWAQELALPRDVVKALCRVHVPLAEWLGARQRALGRPLVVGVNGAQGTGKSTLLWLMARLLPELHGLRAAGLSIDDLYRTAAERAELAARVHPLLRTRGVPGTHDLALGEQVLDALTTGPARSVVLPRFDKATDDRAAPERWPQVRAPVDIVILEGWCVGAAPQEDAELAAPCNALEREEDPRGDWRHHVNGQLRGPYAGFFARLDALVMLQAPDMDCVLRWRLEQERALARALARAVRATRPMVEAEVARFVQHFERLTRAMLKEMPSRADVVIEIDAEHGLKAARYRDGGAR